MTDLDTEVVAVLERHLWLLGPAYSRGRAAKRSVIWISLVHGKTLSCSPYSPSQDESAGLERRALREEGDDLGDREDKVAAHERGQGLGQSKVIITSAFLDSLERTILHDIAIEHATNPHSPHIGRDVLGIDEGRPNGTSTIEALAEAPLALCKLRNSR